MSYYVTNENSVLNINNAHLKVSGNIQTDVMKLGAIEFAPPASDVPGTVNFTNVTTGVTTSSNLNVGGTLMLGSVELVTATAALEQTVNLGNVTSNTVQFTNATTGIVATGNVEASKFIGDGSLLTGITTIESNVDLIRNTDNTAFINLNSNVVTEFPRSKKLIKYPRVALTQNALNNGYTATSSTQESSSRAAWKVFNNAYAEGNGWRGTGTYSTSDGSFTGTWVDFSSGSQTISTPDRGDWLQIILPEKIRLEAVRLQPRYSTTTGGNPASYGRSEFIRNGAIWGSNDGSSWDKVYTINSGLPGSDTSIMTFDGINSTTAYNYFVLVITDTSGTSAGTLASFSEWELFGVPEYDPEAHGTDVVVKSYPNVPNTDWLEVYYDAKNYTSGVVQDESSNSRDATLDGVGYDSVSKSFTFDGGNDKIHMGPFSNFTPTSSYTVSLWFKVPEISSGEDILFHFGHGTGGESFGMNVDNGKLGVFIWDGTSVKTQADIFTATKWVHTTCIANSDGTVEIYFNGILVLSGDTGQALTIPTNPYLSLGIHFSGEQTSFQSSGFFKGSIANFRLFNRALSSDEIYQLYAYQKEDFGYGDLSMTLKAGRLGIGTSEPRAALDVRGSLNFGIPNVHSDSLSGYGSISAATEEAGYAPLGNDMYVVWGNYAIAHTGSGQYNWTWYFPNNFTMTVLSAVGTLRDCGYGYSYDRSGLGINAYYTNRIAGHTKNNTIGAFTQHIHFVVIGKKV
tara:strand:+ start:13677 stop:15896 length:2220 start_codon:yes stop_codon:yes gene_type:complete